MTTLDLDADGERVSGEDALDMLHLAPELRIACARESVRPPRRVDVAVVNLDASEMAGGPAELGSGRHGSRSRQARGTITTLRRNLFQEAAPVEGFDAWAPEASHSKREPLQGRAGIFERGKRQSSIDGFAALAQRLVAEAHPFAKWTADTDHFFRTIRESPSLLARCREFRELMEARLAAALVEAAATHDYATAHILEVFMVAAWRIAHAAATAAYHAGERGDALGGVFLLALEEALGPVRRAARRTPYGIGPVRRKDH